MSYLITIHVRRVLALILRQLPPPPSPASAAGPAGPQRPRPVGGSQLLLRGLCGDRGAHPGGTYILHVPLRPGHHPHHQEQRWAQGTELRTHWLLLVFLMMFFFSFFCILVLSLALSIVCPSLADVSLLACSFFPPNISICSGAKRCAARFSVNLAKRFVLPVYIQNTLSQPIRLAALRFKPANERLRLFAQNRRLLNSHYHALLVVVSVFFFFSLHQQPWLCSSLLFTAADFVTF